MTLDELVGNLKSYEMNVDKRGKETKRKIFDLKNLKVINQIWMMMN